MIYINESQKRRLEEFLEEISYVMYNVQTGLESVWSKSEKHKNSKAWPGKECIFRILVREGKLENLLGKLRSFRITIPKSIIMAAGIVPLEGFIVDFMNEDIEYDDAIIDDLKTKHEK
jgi:hypothetical protein